MYDNNDYGLRPFEYSSHQSEDLSDRLSHFLFVMYAEDLDPKNIGYSFIVKAGSFYEKASPDQRGKHKNPDEVAALGDAAKQHLDHDPVTFKTMLAKPATELTQSISDLSFYRHNYYITLNRYQTPYKYETKSESLLFPDKSGHEDLL